MIDIEAIRKDLNKLKMNFIPVQDLSEDFIREFQDIIDWYWNSYSQKLSENFIRKYQDKVDWLNISAIQKLSKEFIREFSHKICFYSIMYNRVISDEVKEFCRMFI